jgi:GAF domain-containing protein
LVLAAIISETAQQVGLARRRAAERPLRDQFHESIRDALKPIAEYIEQLPALPTAARLERLRTATFAAATALVWELRTVECIRANVFALVQDDDPERMEWMAHAGRGDTPRPFIEGTTRGDAALKFIQEDNPAFYPDLDREHPVGWEGSGSGYRTFISVPVFTENNRYGIVTVDAPKPGALSLGDRYFVEVVAELMAVAFEVATAVDVDDSLPIVGSRS